MRQENICKFVPAAPNAPDELRTVNFVLETSETASTPRICSIHTLCLVTSGKGVFTQDGKPRDIEKGDVFFVVPGCTYAIESTERLEYAYVSFLGLGAPTLIKRLAADTSTPVFIGTDALISFWLQALQLADPQNIDLLSKSVLLYTAAFLIKRTADERPRETVAQIEAYIRTHFADDTLSLRDLADRFGYNPKYLSKLFYRATGVYFADYLTNLRINIACGLMQAQKMSVKEVASACGFSDPLYFSKVFKHKMGTTPTEFMRN